MLVNTPEKFSSAIRYLREMSYLVVDTETNGLDWIRNEICGVSIYSEGSSFYFPFRHGEGENLPIDLLPELISLLNEDKLHIGFHYSFDCKMLAREGMRTPARFDDVMLLAHLMNENEPSFKLEELGKKYLNQNADAEEKFLLEEIERRYKKRGKKAKEHLWKLPAEIVGPYAERDVITTYQLHQFYIPYAEQWRVYDLWKDVCKFQQVIINLEKRGIQLDTPLIEQYIIEAEGHANQLKGEIQRSVGYRDDDGNYTANPASAKQMQAWLGLDSTAAAILEHLDDDRARLLKNYRLWAKANSTYYLPFLELKDANNILHPNLSLIGTVSGRLSCRAPNLQAIPRGSEAYKVKDVFVAREGYILVEADYSQAEMRAAAHYAQDYKLMEMLSSGVDLHTSVAEDLGIPRQVAKCLNFSILYGIGPEKFSQTYRIPLEDSRKYISDYHKSFRKLRQLYFDKMHMAENKGYIRMYSLRVRRFNTINAPSFTACNSLVQGSVAEMVRIAMTRLAKEIPGIHLLLTVHDSIVFEVPQEGYLKYCKEIKRIMEDQPWCTVPITADIKVGKSWGTCKKVDL